MKALMHLLPNILAAANPVDHVVDKAIGGQWVVSNVTVMLVLSAIVTALIVIPAARRIAVAQSATSIDDYHARGLWANFVEAICLGLRDQIFKPLLHEQTDKFMPILWTFFWFILVCNLLGLVPILDATALFGINHGHGIGGTATQSIYVTGALAVVAALYWNVVGFIKDPKGYFLHMTGGAPWYVWPLIVPVEVIGLGIKPFALAVRLFANMTGGHVLLAALLGFVGSLASAFGVLGLGVGLIPLAGAVAVNLLEILVAFLQAFIFTFLTGLFLSQLVHHEHEEEHDEHKEPEASLADRDTPAEGPIPGASV
ncbi:MAG: F0F1 ATP synthase subunit A [Phycisphaeraceae bacterium]